MGKLPKLMVCVGSGGKVIDLPSYTGIEAALPKMESMVKNNGTSGDNGLKFEIGIFRSQCQWLHEYGIFEYCKERGYEF